MVIAATILCGVLSLFVGAGDTTPAQIWDYLRGHSGDAHIEMIVTDLRLPRMFAGLTVGAALGIGGVLLQAATRNPLAETGLLGVNSGAALGVVSGITFFGAETGYAYLLFALAGALLASLFVLLIAARGGGSPLHLILAGVALGATLRGISGYLLLRGGNGFDQYRFWVLGTLSGVESRMLWHAAPLLLAGLLLAVLAVRPLSALLLGDDAAQALGHHPGLIRLIVAITVTLLAAASVALAGPIAFLGLLAPWLARSPRLGVQLTLAGFIGASILLTADMLGRVIMAPFETPASVLVALIGAPLLLRKSIWS